MTKPLDVITIGRSSVDLYGLQVGGRLEDMGSFQKYIGGSPTNMAAGTARLGLKSALITRVGDEHMLQRVYTEDGALDETMAVRNHDVTLVPKGHHPCGAPYGYDLYYLNVMAGPLRKWRFQNDPDHDWIAQRDAG